MPTLVGNSFGLGLRRDVCTAILMGQRVGTGADFWTVPLLPKHVGGLF